MNFYLCQNPLAKKTTGWVNFIYHSEKPRFFAGLQEIDLSAGFKLVNIAGPHQLFIYNRGDGHTQLFLFVVFQNLDRSTKLNAEIKKAAAWYVTILNKEDEIKYGHRSSYTFLQDFNAITPGLQIIQHNRMGTFLVSYDGGVKGFDSQPAMDQFLSKTMGYTDLQLEKGNINVLA